MGIDFSRRSEQTEIIDDMALDRETSADVHRELDVINRWLGGYATTIAALEALLGRGSSDVRILDVGAGGGAMARELVAWGRRQSRRVEVVSVDLSGGAVAFAGEQLAGERRASVVQADVLALPFAAGTFDAAVCTLFLHHFRQSDAARILMALASASRQGVVVNDLHRHPLAYAGIWLLTRLFGANPIVRHDGPLSVLRAFRRADFDELERATGLTLDAQWRWAFRWRVLVRGHA